jgi:hypothetical protein
MYSETRATVSSPRPAANALTTAVAMVMPHPGRPARTPGPERARACSLSPAFQISANAFGPVRRVARRR